MVLRFFSGLFLLAATLALISEATRAQLGVPGAPFTPLLTQFSEAAPVLMTALQRNLSKLHPFVWDPMVRSFLLIPAWISLGAIGALLGWLGRRRRQIKVFTN